MESTIRLKDNRWDIFEFTEKDLSIYEHSISQEKLYWIPESSPIEDRELVKLYFRQDSSTKLYKREEYDLLTYFGDLGGLLEFALLFGWTISSVFVSRLLQAALVKQAYRVQRYLLDMTPYYESTKPVGQLTTESDSDSDGNKSVEKDNR